MIYTKPVEEPKKLSRTEKLLKDLKVPDDFLDKSLPNGYFSHSQYSSWRICGAAYEFKYLKNEYQPKYVAPMKGTAVHSGAESLLRLKMKGQSVVIDSIINDICEAIDIEALQVEEWGEDAKGAPITVDTVKRDATNIVKHFALYVLPKLNPQAVEHGFAVKLGSVPMVGWIDMIDSQPIMPIEGMKLSAEEMVLLPRKKIVVDFKTGKAKWSDKELRTDTQMTLYSGAMHTPHVRVDQLLTQAKGPVYIPGESERNNQDIRVLTEDINEIADYIRKGIFPKAAIDSWNCNPKQCAFWSLCRGKKNGI